MVCLMTISIYALNLANADRPDAPFNLSFTPPDPNATVYLGNPRNRFLTKPESMQVFKIVVPATASMEGGMLKWVDGDDLRWLTAEEVYSLARRGADGFYFAFADA